MIEDHYLRSLAASQKASFYDDEFSLKKKPKKTVVETNEVNNPY
jgi:hypothetical protein